MGGRCVRKPRGCCEVETGGTAGGAQHVLQHARPARTPPDRTCSNRRGTVTLHHVVYETTLHHVVYETTLHHVAPRCTELKPLDQCV